MTPPLLSVGAAATDVHLERPRTSPIGAHARGSARRAETGELWAVVLAGGSGVRLRPLTRVVCGDERPKQYVTLTGSRSLLQQTLDRAALRIPAQRTVVVSVEAQARHLAAALSGCDVNLLLQPADRGTAAGVLLPAHWIRQRAPDATIVVFPSDHLVVERDVFMDQVLGAAAYVDGDPGRIVLLGAEPTDAETEYGWIEPGPLLDRSGPQPIRAVWRFFEKPTPETARACLAVGGVWNTFVFVGRASALVDAGRRCVPRVHAGLERLVHAAGRGAHPDALRRIAAALPRANFSRDVLERVTPALAVATLAGVTWCDWGSPGRVVASLARLGIRPAWLDQLAEPDVTGSAR